ncbi:MAG TPA: SDR family oxidoreductase [Gemmatimonadaceae bacterium]|nr:SDR family oxidoreductase [Gemmatimonadaceae bacterium]
MRRTILVTGGTGTLGRELVRRLRQDPDAPRVLVLARTATITDAGASVVRGDLLARPRLGIDPASYDELRREVTHVVHCAAATRFTLPLEEARSVNVAGTRAVLELAAECRRLQGIACFSTVYVSGRRTGVFAESDCGDAGAGFVNSYEQSKAEMEELVRGAISQLPIVLFRLSTIIGDSRTGTVTGFNALHQALRLLYQGLVPMMPGEATTEIDLIPLDFAADASHALLRCMGQGVEAGHVYHLCAGHARSTAVGTLLDATMSAFTRHRPAWRRRTVERPAFADARTYELFVRSVEEAGNEVLLGATRAVQAMAWQLAYPKTFDDRRAAAMLDPLGIRAPAVLDYYPEIVRYCVETNWGTTA